jgi:hypothetical protein
MRIEDRSAHKSVSVFFNDDGDRDGILPEITILDA